MARNVFVFLSACVVTGNVCCHGHDASKICCNVS